MKSILIFSFCALVAVSGIQTGEDERNEQEVTEGLTKPEIMDDPFPQSFPVVHKLYSKLNNHVSGIPLTIQGAFVQSQDPYGAGHKQFSPLDMQRIKCGNPPCPRTWFVCQSAPCQYPGEFDELIQRCRSSLQNAEDLFHSIAELLLTASGKMVRDGVFIKTADADTVFESSKAILAVVAENIASLEQFLSNEVIGQVAQDVLIDLEDLHTVLTVLVKRFIEVDQGEEAKLPVSVYDRCFRPRDWTPQCSGRWPCTRIILFPTRYAYSQQRPGCSCQFSGFQYGSRVIQPIQEFPYQLPNPELTYQQPSQIFMKTLPLQMLSPSLHQQPLTSSHLQGKVQSSQLLVVAQPQPQQLPEPLQSQLFSQSQVYAQPQYRTVRYQPSVPLTSDQVSPISSMFSKNQLSSGSNMQQALSQTNPQQIFEHPQYQELRHFQNLYPETITPFENKLNQPVTRRENVQQSIIYRQPQYQTVKQYAPAIYTSDDVGGDFKDGNHSAQQTFTQFTQKPKFVPAQQFTSPQQYQQYQSVFFAPVPPQAEYGQSLITRQDNSTKPQQPDGQQLGFAQTPQQYFTQPPYIQYKPAKYAAGARSLDNSPNPPDGQFVEPLHQVYRKPQYQTVKQIQPAIYSPASEEEEDFSLPVRISGNSTEVTTQKNR